MELATSTRPQQGNELCIHDDRDKYEIIIQQVSYRFRFEITILFDVIKSLEIDNPLLRYVKVNKKEIEELSN